MAYVPPGPVMARFLASDAFLRGAMGPVGSGKTGGCLMDMIYRAMRQAPHPRDGFRRTKFAVVRDTYRQLEKTTIPSWHRWVPETLGHWVGGSGGQPARHTVTFALQDGSKVELIVEFIGLGENNVANVMPGWEGTGAYLNEADKLTPETLHYIRSRVGRYPARDNVAGFQGATWRGVWADFNAPDTEHWLYDTFVENPVTGTEFFPQPGGLIETKTGYIPNPTAENIANLPEGYYEQMLGMPRWFIRRMVLNKWGASRDGEPVYEEFNDEVHVAPHDLEPVRGLPLLLGADAGLTPALIIGQIMPSGQWRILDELIAPKTGMGAKRFGDLTNQLLVERYAPWCPGPSRRAITARRDEYQIIGHADPASSARSATDEQSWLQVYSAATNIHFRPAPSNNLTPRLEAVRQPLSRLIDGEPGFLLSPRCKVLRKGFNSGYRLKRLTIGGGERFSDQPDKNEFSHPHDGLQYLMLGGGGHLAILGRQQLAENARRQTRAYDDEYPEEIHSRYDGRQAYASD